MFLAIFCAVLAVFSAQVSGSVSIDTTDISVSSFSPNFGSVDGGTTVTVSGVGFVAPSRPVCRLWGQNGLVYGEPPHFVDATVVNDTTLTCVTDAFPCAALVYLDVSMDNVTFSANNDNLTFNYVQLMDVSAGRSLYNCGSQDKARDDASVSVLVKLHPLLANVVTKTGATPPQASLLQRRMAGIAGAGGPSSRRHDHHDYAADGPPMNVTVRATVGSTSVSMSVPVDGQVYRLELPAAQFVAVCPSHGAPVVVELQCAGCPAIVRKPLLYAYPYTANQVYVDYAMHVTIANGAPYYVYGWMMNGEASDESLQSRLAQMAFRGTNTVFAYICDGRDPTIPPCVHLSALEYLLDTSHTLGLRVQADVLALVGAILANDTSQTLGYLKETVLSLKDHPALLGYYISDDTIIDNRPHLADAYDLIRSVDPYHPMYNTISGSGNAWEYQSPRVAFDVAQYEEYDLSDPYYNLPTIPTDWPMAWVAQGICGQAFVDSGATENSPRLQAYMSVLGHGTSVIGWDWWNWSPYVSQTVIFDHYYARAEIFVLASAMLSGELRHPTISIDNVDPPVPARGGPVVGRAWRRSDGVVMVAVANIRKAPSAFTITMDFLPPGTNNTIDVLFQGYTINVTDKNATSFSSYMDGFGTRVYVWTPVPDSRAMVPTPAAAPAPSTALQRRLGDGAFTNFVHNPSFESSSSPYFVNAWTPGFKYGPGPWRLANLYFRQDLSVSTDGAASFRIVNQGVISEAPVWTFFPIPMDTVSGGYSYHMNVSVRVSQPKPADPPANVAFCFLDKKNLGYPISPGILCSAAYNASDAYQWRTLACTEKFPSTRTFAVGLCTSGVGAMWLDNVLIYS